MEEFNKKKNDLETQKAEAEAMMDGAEVGRLEKELAQLEANKHTYETITAEVAQDATENQIKQITELGGSEEILHEKVEAKQEEAKKVEEVKEEKSEGVNEKVPNDDIENKVGEEIEPGADKEEIGVQVEEVKNEKEVLRFPKNVTEIDEYLQSKYDEYDKVYEKEISLLKKTIESFSEDDKRKALSPTMYNYALSLTEKNGKSLSENVETIFEEGVKKYIKGTSEGLDIHDNTFASYLDKVLTLKGMDTIKASSNVMATMRYEASRLRIIRNLDQMRQSDPEKAKSELNEYLFAYTRYPEEGRAAIKKLNVLKDMVSLGVAEKDQYEKEKSAYISGELSKYNKNSPNYNEEEILKSITYGLL